MAASSTFVNMDGKLQMLSLPPEIIAHIFALLPSFSDALCLAAVCRRLRNIWVLHVSSISASIAPRSILCERHARRFLADSGGPPPDIPISCSDHVRSLLRHSRMVERAIREFERVVVPRIPAAGFDLRLWYGPSARRHPPRLTRTERRRFTRTYYVLLSLFLYRPPESWPSDVRKLPLKSLYTLFELSALNQLLPGEEPPRKRLQGRELLFYHGGAKRIQLQQCLKEELENKYDRTWGMFFIDPWMAYQCAGALCFVLVWDYRQEELRGICCQPVGTSPEKRQAVRLEDVWEESDEEGP